MVAEVYSPALKISVIYPYPMATKVETNSYRSAKGHSLSNSLLRLFCAVTTRSGFGAVAAFVCLLSLGTSALRSQTQRGLELTETTAQQESNGGYYALVIGINDYPAPLPMLKTAVHDAQAVADLLRGQYGFQVTTLLNQDATRDNILKAMTHFRKSLAENDNLLIYYAGHGSFDREAGKGYWIPIDADPDPLDTSHDISADDITTEARSFVARHVLIVSDSCFSGDLSRAASTLSPSDGNKAYIRRMLRAPSRTIMASGSDEPVSDSGSEGHSVFAALLLEAMQTRPDATFTAEDLFVSIRKSVLTRSGQSPQYAALRNSVRASASLDNGDFVFTRGAALRVAPAASTQMSAADAYAKAADFYRVGKFSQEFPLLTAACAGGDADGCYDLGDAYRFGYGAEQNSSQASAFYLKAFPLLTAACARGDADGCFDLGTAYRDGKGVNQDSSQASAFYLKASRLLTAACDKGNAQGCLRLGQEYQMGFGVGQDLARAVGLFRKACDSAEREGCVNLAQTYLEGFGGEKDHALGLALDHQVCDAGYMAACYQLGWDYEQGLGVEMDQSQALPLFRKACDESFALGCLKVGNSFFAKDPTQAITFYHRACDGGVSVACSDLQRLGH